MRYKCVMRHLKSDEIAVAAREHSTPEARTGTVLVEVERSVVDVGPLSQALAREAVKQSWMPVGWCSLSGQVTQSSSGVDGIRPGDRVSAIGPVASRVVLPAQECLVVPDSVGADQAAWWALLIALVRFIRRLRIEIGESVVVLGAGLVGRLVAQLSWVAGAASVVGLDPERGDDDKSSKVRGQGLAPTWVTTQDALQKALPNGKADVLINTLSNLAELNRLLSLVQEKGRAMLLAANDMASKEFDFYPNVHRRSLKITSGTLRSALQQNPDGEVRYAREAEFINHLFKEDRLDLTCWAAACIMATHSAEQIVSIAGKTGLIVQWKDYDRAGQAFIPFQ